jgi:hypothetical protein
MDPTLERFSWVICRALSTITSDLIGESQKEIKHEKEAM